MAGAQNVSCAQPGGPPPRRSAQRTRTIGARRALTDVHFSVVHHAALRLVSRLERQADGKPAGFGFGHGTLRETLASSSRALAQTQPP